MTRRSTSAARAGHKTGKLIAIIAGTIAAGSIVGFISVLAWPTDNSTHTQPSVDIHVEPDSELPALTPLPRLQNSASADLPKTLGASAIDPLIGTKVGSAQLGTAQSYNDTGKLVDFDNVDPRKSQVEQGLDDKSGMEYPCVFLPGDGDVCQRKLTKSEAQERGF